MNEGEEPRNDVRRFLIKAALFGAPLIAFLAVMMVTDPFGRFGRSRVFPEAARETAASAINEQLWRVIQVEHGVGENVLVGGSKMGLLKADAIKRLTGRDYQNLSMGGASVTEMVNLFWIAAHKSKLRDVVFGVNIETINRYVQRDRVTAAETTAHNPLLYLSNRDVLSAMVNLTSATFLGGQLASNAPPMNREQFWRFQLTDWVSRVFSSYAFDEVAYGRLQEVSRYCAANGIHLKILILPSHADVHRRLRELGLEAAWHEASARFSQLGGETYDFDVDDAITANRENFRDPFHFMPAVADQLIRKAWGVKEATAGTGTSSAQ